MGSNRNPSAGQRARLVEQLTQRLELAHELALELRGQMTRGTTDEIETGTARLETVAQEFKLLAEEYGRLGPESEATTPGARDNAAKALAETAARVARSSALTGGLLERMVAVSRCRLGLLAGTQDGTYGKDGRGPEFDARGLRLKEWV